MGKLSGTYSEYVILFLAYTILLYCLKSFKYSFDINLLFIILLVLINLIASVSTYEGYYELKFLLLYWIPRYFLWILLLSRSTEIGFEFFQRKEFVYFQLLLFGLLILWQPIVAVKISGYLGLISIFSKGKWSYIYGLFFLLIVLFDLSVRLNYILLLIVIYKQIPKNILSRFLLVGTSIVVVLFVGEIIEIIADMEISFKEGNTDVSLLADTRTFIVLEIWNTLSTDWQSMLVGLPATKGYATEFFGNMLSTGRRLHTEMLMVNFWMHLGLLGVVALLLRLLKFGRRRNHDVLILFSLIMCSVIGKPETLTLYNFLVIPLLFSKSFGKV